MVNTDRIVPIQKIDRISAIGEAMRLAGTSFTVLGAADVAGNFTVSTDTEGGVYLLNQPAVSIKFAGTGRQTEIVYFIPNTDFNGITGAQISADSDEIVADGISLYKALGHYTGYYRVDVTKITP